MTRKVFSEDELKILFRMAEQKFSLKQISDALNCKKSAVRMRILRAKLAAELPPKEKVSKSTVKGRLANLTKILIRDHPNISYPQIPVKLKEIYGINEKLPSYKAFERFLKRSKSENVSSNKLKN
jgi:hypothetical protein